MDNFRLAEIEDINDILQIYSNCSDWLLSKGMDHLQGVYEFGVVKENIENRSLYVLLEGKRIIGVMKISNNRPWYYRDEEQQHWEEPNLGAIYMSGLVVDPLFHGKGHAVELLNHVESIAQSKNMKYIRLDCVQNDEKLLEFYKNRGYEIKFSRDIGEPKFYFFEKKL